MRVSTVAVTLAVALALAAAFRAPAEQAYGELDGDGLVKRLASLPGSGQAALAQELKAIKTARDGVACLNGTGPCPDGQRSPLR